MPIRDFDPGIGPQGIQAHGLTITLQPPADTNATINVIVQDAPLRWARTGTTGLGRTVVRCVDGDVPDMIALARIGDPTQDLGVLLLPGGGTINHPSTASFVYKLKVVAAPPPVAGTALGVLAAGPGTWKVVLKTAGIGDVIWIDAGGYAYVLF